jgi:hypothetical protein
MTWSPPDRYEGKLVLPTGAPASGPAPSSEESTFERIASAVEELYAREPILTRALLEDVRMASAADLERLFRS